MIKQPKSWKRAILSGVGAVVLAGGVFWGVAQSPMVFAQSNQPDTQAAQTQPNTDQNGWFGWFGGQGVRGLFGRGGPHGGFGLGAMQHGSANGQALLANALGITEAELQTAHQTVAEKALEKAVADGLLTQAQADQLKARPGFGMRGDVGRVFTPAEADAALADALGITVEDLTAARNTMFDKGVEAGLLTQAQANELKVQQMLRNATQEARKNALDQAVKDGLLTQQQADNILNGQGRMGFGPMMGGRGGDFHRGHGMDRQGGPRFQQPGGSNGDQDNNQNNQDNSGSSGSNFFVPDNAQGSGSNL
ncbi:MAG: hypothetical protein R3C14_24220 [Caldilineaceae bacterium]